MDVTERLDQARAAFTACSWQDAYDGFEACDPVLSLEPFDLEQFATAAYLTGHDAQSTEAWSRAHQRWQDVGDKGAAVRCAFWLGFALVQRGDMAQGGGWLARASRMVEEHELDSVERGYLEVPAGLMAMDAGECEAALDRFAQADTMARRFGDRDLAALGTLGRGEALLRLGQTSQGLSLFDEAMVAVTAGETSPMISGLVYCAVIDRCHRVFDLRRAGEWTAALDQWCHQQPGLVPYRGQCLVHRAQVLQLRGDWVGAVAEAERARQWLSDPPHPALGMAQYQLGELHRLRGEPALAEDLYRRAHASGRDPQPGLALLRLAEGRTESAVAAIETALDGAGDPLSRVRLLPAYAEIMLAAGRAHDARTACDELDDVARESGGATMLLAVANQARGALLLAADEPREALGVLRAALDTWQELDAPYEAAQVRVLMAVACHRLDDRDRVELECDVARDVFEQLGARPALERLTRLLVDDPADVGPSGASSRPKPVTGRELQVLRLVAAGQTNREIGLELAISERTVERHLGNIFAKLGVSNRAAATAHAYDHGLL